MYIIFSGKYIPPIYTMESASKKSASQKSASQKSSSKKSTSEKSESQKSSSKKSTSEKSESKKSTSEKSRLKKSIRRITAKKIANFMRKVDPHKHRALFLRSICSDAGVCIAFGKEIQTINKHFDGFVNFKHIKSPIIRIGTPSLNGFVNELTYEHNGYIANAILKSSTRKQSDNLFYEYLVGQYINKQCRIFPCFVETYGWFTYKTPELWEKMQTNKVNDDLSNYLQLQSPKMTPDSLDIACSQSQYLAVLLQHIKDANTLQYMTTNTYFVKYHLPQVLYQIYMPLSTLANTFTHYDLHLENVLIYQPVRGRYIDYHYKLIDGTSIRFKSPYIAKMIDYGRSFFEDKDNSSKAIYDEICNTNNCNPSCGNTVGFSTLSTYSSTAQFFLISSKRNMSYDLRLMNEIMDKPYQVERIYYDNQELFKRLYKKISYGKGIIYKDNQHYGTKEETNTGLPNQIANVIDAEHALRAFLLESKVDDPDYDKMKSLGTLTIHQDGTPMKFSPTM